MGGPAAMASREALAGGARAHQRRRGGARQR
jgi:hypothetical protein